MSTYVIDTNVIREWLEHFPKKGKFSKIIFERIEDAINTGLIVSVDECFNELEKHYSEDSEHFPWIKAHKKMFLVPTNRESLVIKEIFRNVKMIESVSRKNIVEGRPSADVYLVAKAKELNGVIVTKEGYKPHSARIPNMCALVNVQCISYDDFMEEIESSI